MQELHTVPIQKGLKELGLLRPGEATTQGVQECGLKYAVSGHMEMKADCLSGCF